MQPITNAATQTTIVTGPDGSTFETSILNAQELVGLAKGYKMGSATDEPPVDEDASDEQSGQAEQSSSTEADEQKTLVEQMAFENGYATIEEYLNTFDVESLRHFAADQFEEKVHHKTGKETLVARIIELDKAA